MAKARTSPKKGPTKKFTASSQSAAKSTAEPAATNPRSKPATAVSKEPPAPTAHAPEALDGADLPATHGKVALLGGPKDRGIKPDDKLALPCGPHFAYERVRSLDPKSFYCAMRWNYKLQNRSPEEGKRWWANKKLLVTNPKTRSSVVVRAVDYGPHEKTGLDISLSPGAAAALGVEVGDEVDIAFADQHAALGAVK